jgi:hypothetical protein
MFKVIILLLIATNVYAAEPFGLRFTSALDRFPNSADTAALSASVGSARGASNNPAAIGWNKFSGNAITPTYTFLNFANGTNLNVLTTTYTRGAGDLGNLQLTFTKVLSNEEKMLNKPLLYSYDMNYYKTQWGYHVTDDLTIGLNLNYTKSETNNKGYLVSNSTTYGTSFGMLYRLTQKILVGSAVDYSQSPSDTNVYKYKLNLDDTTRKIGVKTGVSNKLLDNTYINFDVQYCSFRNNTEKYEVVRFATGVEYTFVEYLVFKTGVVFDADGNKSYSGGLRIYPSKKINIDIGYQHNMYPEVKTEFGMSNLYTISLGIML